MTKIIRLVADFGNSIGYIGCQKATEGKDQSEQGLDGASRIHRLRVGDVGGCRWPTHHLAGWGVAAEAVEDGIPSQRHPDHLRCQRVQFRGNTVCMEAICTILEVVTMEVRRFLSPYRSATWAGILLCIYILMLKYLSEFSLPLSSIINNNMKAKNMVYAL